MNYHRLEKIGNVSGYIAIFAACILTLIIFTPGLKDNAWITEYVVGFCGFTLLLFGGLLLTTSLGINVMRSGELAQMILFVSVPMPKPIARLIGFGFFLLGSMALLCFVLMFAAFAFEWLR